MKYITKNEMDNIIGKFDNVPYLPHEKNNFYTFWQGKVIACYNETGDCFVEEFNNLYSAYLYLETNVDLGEICILDNVVVELEEQRHSFHLDDFYEEEGVMQYKFFAHPICEEEKTYYEFYARYENGVYNFSVEKFYYEDDEWGSFEIELTELFTLEENNNLIEKMLRLINEEKKMEVYRNEANKQQ